MYNIVILTGITYIRGIIKKTFTPFSRCIERARNVRKHNAEMYKKRLLAVQFFDSTLECPEDIVNCESKRSEYTQILKRYEKIGGCRPCDMPYIQEMIVNSFILKSE